MKPRLTRLMSGSCRKLLDEKVATLHLPVLGAALTALTQQHTVSRVSRLKATCPVCGRMFCRFFASSRLFVGERLPVQFASLTPFVSETKSEDVTHEEHAHSSHTSSSHDCDMRSVVFRQARQSPPVLESTRFLRSLHAVTARCASGDLHFPPRTARGAGSSIGARSCPMSCPMRVSTYRRLRTRSRKNFEGLVSNTAFKEWTYFKAVSSCHLRARTTRSRWKLA